MESGNEMESGNGMESGNEMKWNPVSTTGGCGSDTSLGEPEVHSSQ
jgi:hypothetical protein